MLPNNFSPTLAKNITIQVNSSDITYLAGKWSNQLGSKCNRLLLSRPIECH